MEELRENASIHEATTGNNPMVKDFTISFLNKAWQQIINYVR